MRGCFGGSVEPREKEGEHGISGDPMNMRSDSERTEDDRSDDMMVTGV